MKVLNLIVHEEMLEKYRDIYDNVLRRIREINDSDNNTAFIPWDNMNFETALKLSENYDAVVLFGGSRAFCLNKTFEILSTFKIPVSYDIEGTI